MLINDKCAIHITSSSQVSAGGSVGYSSFLASGKVSVDVDTLNERVTASSKFGSELNTFTIGTMEIPLPIKMQLRPIYDALEQKYWTNIPAGATYESLSLKTKMTNLQMAFVEYPEKAGSLLQGEREIVHAALL